MICENHTTVHGLLILTLHLMQFFFPHAFCIGYILRHLFLKVEEEDYDDEEEEGMKSTRTRETTLTSPGPPLSSSQADRMNYRYQLRPSSSGRRSNAGAGSDDAGSVALSDKYNYKRVGRPSRPKSDDQVGGHLSTREKSRGIISTISIL